MRESSSDPDPINFGAADLLYRPWRLLLADHSPLPGF
nr:MAG TPA: hypothetical protein [Caudoviricetes sp.]